MTQAKPRKPIDLDLKRQAEEWLNEVKFKATSGYLFDYELTAVVKSAMLDGFLAGAQSQAAEIERLKREVKQLQPLKRMEQTVELNRNLRVLGVSIEEASKEDCLREIELLSADLQSSRAEVERLSHRCGNPLCGRVK